MSSEGYIFPASEGTLIYFASYLARTVKHTTIKLYLSAVRNLHISCRHGDPLYGKLLLHRVLRAILPYQGQSRILCQPVTLGVLAPIQPIQLHKPSLPFFGVVNLLIPGQSSFARGSTFLLTVYHFILVWLAHSKCLFSSMLLRPTFTVKGTCLLLRAPLH